MKLEGIHHITMITGDAQRNVGFYADILGLRPVKRTVNFDAPEAYHLYFGDEHGSPVIDRDYFSAIYFRQPHGILFEIATTSPGFAIDEDLEHLGEQLRRPRQHEHLRPQLERHLTPDHQSARRSAAGGLI